MKTIFSFFAFLCFITVTVRSQNTFPTSGNVGIGTSAPVQKLDIVGTASVWPLRLQNSDGNFDWHVGVTGNSWLAGGDKFVIGTSANSPDAEFAIDPYGKIGIGTTAPSQKLDIVGTTSTWPLRLQNSNGNHDWYVGVTGNAWGIEGNRFVISSTPNSPDSEFIIDPSGNIGIGTTSPAQKLDIAGSDSIWPLRLQNSDGGYDWHVGVTGNSWAIGGNKFAISNTLGSNDAKPVIEENGDVGIGPSSPDAKLAVKGDIHAEEVRVDLSVPGPDYVFEEEYDLPTLESLQKYIQSNKHLPEIPSAKDMEGNGIDLGIMNMLLLKKIEELTLYVIQQEDKIKQLEEKNRTGQENLENEIEELRSLVTRRKKYN